eukprot:Protomagalhaensia_wolfi_Nauph_80__3500@NODE_354_length_2702_cov_139_442734_g266_i0_p1_GENE_NODE_354_length_2702_cov_139_442734_g266_i0NODE_354_length_2702_cov_139_442734_g266_i0_p1_ORF_typecomplete_len559_score94_99ANAPC4_WD40/PF12894_7/6e03ANAPC4_WD40/PF12894_7/6_1e12ANAPC4_WD40/PF12894_7/0_049ANAPC4_WD40/PF12894_7/7_4e08ANAPC4_WD40/PF12894_7/7_1e06WD40/PF00400_32/7_2e02WD40/PF00400_32/0_0079WD40/PF00400_32/2_4WD40/PF00400_32/0_036WD40/PF00400_32/0_03WD40/PF00400_32/2_8e09Ge1_WD40/PF16529_5/0_0
MGMIDGGPIFTLELGCGNSCDPRCPCDCHENSTPPNPPPQHIRFKTQEGYDFQGTICDVDFQPNASTVADMADSEPDQVQKALRDLIKQYPLASRPYFETRRRRRVPKSCAAMLKLTSPIVDDFYLNLLDWGPTGLVTVSSASSLVLLKPRPDKADFELVSKFRNALAPPRPDRSPPPLAEAQPNSPEHNRLSNTVTPLTPHTAVDSDYTSVKWSRNGTRLAAGCHHGLIEVWDVESERVIRILGGHTQRVGTLDWVPVNGDGPSNLLTSGSRDKIILCHDLRAENSIASILDRHKQEVCGLAWRPASGQNRHTFLEQGIADQDMASSSPECPDRENEDGVDEATLLERDWRCAAEARPFSTRRAKLQATKALTAALSECEPDLGGKLGGSQPKLASGGNDNKVYIWDFGYQSPIARLSVHQAAVKALTWAPCPVPLLVSGGGTNDRSIRLWDIACKKELATCETESQVCNLFWSPATLEVISSHGYTLNQVNVWDLRQVATDRRDQKPLGFRKLATLTGHTARVLYMSPSPDGRQVCTAAGDGTVRLWSAFMDHHDH